MAHVNAFHMVTLSDPFAGRDRLDIGRDPS